jgi:hypothetical protein
MQLTVWFKSIFNFLLLLSLSSCSFACFSTSNSIKNESQNSKSYFLVPKSKIQGIKEKGSLEVSINKENLSSAFPKDVLLNFTSTSLVSFLGMEEEAVVSFNLGKGEEAIQIKLQERSKKSKFSINPILPNSLGRSGKGLIFSPGLGFTYPQINFQESFSILIPLEKVNKIVNSKVVVLEIEGTVEKKSWIFSNNVLKQNLS